MGSNPRHIAAGIAAVTDSASISSYRHTIYVWVSPDDVAHAINTAKKLSNSGAAIPTLATDSGSAIGLKLC